MTKQTKMTKIFFSMITICIITFKIKQTILSNYALT